MILDIAVGVGSCLVVPGALVPGPIRGPLDSPVCAWFGAISYSLYFVRVPLILAATLLSHAVLPAWRS